MITGMDKAWVAGIVGLVSAVILQMTGAGEGPTPEQIGGIGDMASALVVAAINMGLVWLVPNKATA
jgi:hypothetical protein